MSLRSDCFEEAFATSSNRDPAEITVIFLLGKQPKERERSRRRRRRTIPTLENGNFMPVPPGVRNSSVPRSIYISKSGACQHRFSEMILFLDKKYGIDKNRKTTWKGDGRESI
jgi:hypothetical protein